MDLAVPNLHVSPMPPTKFQLNPTNGSGVDVISRFLRWPLLRPSSILELNNASHQVQSDLPFGSRYVLKIFSGGHLGYRKNGFSHTEPLSCSNAFHQVSAQSNLQFRRCHLKIFKMADMAAILDIRRE